jgi:hypothetical protein
MPSLRSIVWHASKKPRYCVASVADAPCTINRVRTTTVGIVVISAMEPAMPPSAKIEPFHVFAVFSDFTLFTPKRFL